jgi:hypothetical protein
MSITCPECSIRYASDLPACPWCGHVIVAAATPAAVERREPANPTPTHTESTTPAAAEGRASEPPTPTHTASATPAAAESRASEHPTPTHTESAPPAPQPQRPSVAYDLGSIPGPDEEWEPIDEWLEDETATAEVADPDRLKRWGIYILGGIALLAFGAWLAEVLPIGVGTSAASPTPTSAVASTAAPTTAAPTTAPPASTTTSAPPPAAPTIAPVEPALAVGDLRLSEDGLGELEFGSDGLITVGRLVATFGQPDSDSGVVAAPAVESGGFCEGELQRVVRWGALSIYNAVGDDGAETFASVVIEDGASDHPANGLSTLSDLGIGDTVAELRAIYEGFRIEFAAGTEDAVWEVRASSDGRLLVWGTSSGTGEPDDVVTSIRSSRRCG